MKKTRSLLGLIILMSFFFSCQKDKIKEDINEKTPGRFNLTQIAGAESAIKKNISTEFDFGDIKASKEFYFLLANVGDEPIFLEGL